jgi:ATP-dependent RNA circularization protein (DNA/RNA ligase family)
MSQHLTTIKKKKLFLQTYWSSKMQVCEACSTIGINRQTFYRWLKADQEFKQAYDDLGEAILDRCESELVKCIEKGDKDIIRWILEKKGKARGYGEAQKMEHTGEITLNIVKTTIDGPIKPKT